MQALSDFLAAADATSAEVIAQQLPSLEFVHEADQFIRTRVLEEKLSESPAASLLALNAYYSFLAAARVAISGQQVAVYPLIRHALECSCYAYLIAHDQSLDDLWMKRHQDADHFKACKKAFGSAVSDVVKALRADDKSATFGGLIEDHYQQSIDFGAHPNANSIVPHVSVGETETDYVVELVCLYGPKENAHQQGLIVCAEVGMVVAHLIAYASKGHSLQDENFGSLDSFYTKLKEHIATL